MSEITIFKCREPDCNFRFEVTENMRWNEVINTYVYHLIMCHNMKATEARTYAMAWSSAFHGELNK